MPSAKYLFLTAEDEKTLSAVLRQKFPDIRFCAREYWEREFHYYADISSCPSDEVDMFLAPATWEPEFAPNESVDDKAYKVVNRPDEWMFLHRYNTSKWGGEEHVLRAATFQVGVTPPPMSKRQLSLTNKIWRLLPRMGTYTLMYRTDKGWIKAPDKMYFAGNDALRWALEDDRRYFDYIGAYRPFKPDAEAVPP
jgi:hypothetical protein